MDFHRYNIEVAIGLPAAFLVAAPIVWFSLVPRLPPPNPLVLVGFLGSALTMAFTGWFLPRSATRRELLAAGGSIRGLFVLYIIGAVVLAVCELTLCFTSSMSPLGAIVILTGLTVFGASTIIKRRDVIDPTAIRWERRYLPILLVILIASLGVLMAYGLTYVE